MEPARTTWKPLILPIIAGLLLSVTAVAVASLAGGPPAVSSRFPQHASDPADRIPVLWTAPLTRPLNRVVCASGLPEECALGAFRRLDSGDPGGASRMFAAACDGGSSLACLAQPETEADLDWPTPELQDAVRRDAFLGVARDEHGLPRPADADRFALELCLGGVARVCLAHAVEAEALGERGRALRFYALACRAGYPNGCAAAAVLSAEQRRGDAARGFARDGCEDGSSVACSLLAALTEDHLTFDDVRQSFGRKCAADPMRGCEHLDVLARFAGIRSAVGLGDAQP
ncbi:MAG: hypothetical protein HY905_25525 [Deltaproteobacteria bacterium]|nr:hypothetical protein [Deltaproteobacteria bacterium]